MNTNDTTSKKNRTVIYGGTFAPIHMGHVHAVRACREQLRPDRMLVMPANIPPHKQIDPADQPMRRYEMACLALEDEAGYGDSLTVSDYELSCDGKSYTVNTLRHFAAPDTTLTLLCGTDMFLTLDTWYRAEEIFRLARIALIRRESDAKTQAEIAAQSRRYTERYGAEIVTLHCDAVELSSSEIRKTVAAGGCIRGLVPEKVEAYIRENGLYRREECK